MNSEDYITNGTWQKREQIKLGMRESAINAYGYGEGEFYYLASDEYPCREILYYGGIKIGEIPNNDELQNV